MRTLCYTLLATFACSVLETSFALSADSACNPPKRVYNTSGDVIIGGLIPVHIDNGVRLNEPGVLWVEAMMFAIREINKNQTLLPSLKLGFDIRDSCNGVDLGLSAVLDFMLTRNHKHNSSYIVSKDNSSTSSCFCNLNNSSFPPVMAVVGGASSSVSASVSPLLSVDDIPQISYSSTSPTLSDKTLYSSFLRTIPSDIYQAKVIADMLKHFNWSYVSVVVSDDEYGRNGLVALRARLKEKDICIAVEAMFTTSSPEETDHDSANIVRSLQADKRATVVVLWCARPQAMNFLKSATGRVNVTWIGTESWGDNARVKDEISFDVIGGMLGVLPYHGRHPEFENYLQTLTPKTAKSDLNPWLQEYWAQDRFNSNVCVLSPSNCSDDDLPSALSLPLNKYANVIDAVYAIAYGLDSMIQTHPNNRTLTKSRLGELLNHIKKVQFPARSGRGTFKFTKTGDPSSGAYVIKNLQGNKHSSDFVTIAQWDGETSNLDFNDGVSIQWHTGRNSTPVSRCSEICPPGFYVVTSSKPCCWSCQKCGEGFFKRLEGNLACHKCKEGYNSNDNRTDCMKVDEDYLRWGSPLSIFILISCFLGVVLVVFVIAVFRNYSRTAVVKASNRELSIVQLVCHALIFLLPLLFIGRPRELICVVCSYLFSILFTVITSIMFLKTDRIVRIFNSKSRLTKRSRLLSNKVQFILTFVMTCVPASGTTVWILLKPLTVVTERVNSADNRFIVFCDHAGTLHIIQLSYILLLALLCTYEAYNARKLPENFNEAKFICFSMFGFVLMWLGYIPGYQDVEGATKQFMTSLFALLTNFTILCLIFGPKLRIILFHPERNRQEAFRQATLKSYLQQAHRLSPGNTPDTPRSRALTLNSPVPATSIDSFGKLRSASLITVDSVGSREFGTSVEKKDIVPSPLALESVAHTSSQHKADLQGRRNENPFPRSPNTISVESSL